MVYKPTKYEDWQVEELLNEIFQLTDEQAEEVDYDHLVLEEWGIDFDSFTQIVRCLAQFTVPVSCCITNKKMKGFVKDNRLMYKLEQDLLS